jgi:hypothetical protein
MVTLARTRRSQVVGSSSSGTAISLGREGKRGPWAGTACGGGTGGGLATASSAVAGRAASP